MQKALRRILEFIGLSLEREECSKTIVYNKFYIAGYQYYKGSSLALGLEDILQMKREKNNKYDARAIALSLRALKLALFHNVKMVLFLLYLIKTLKYMHML